MREKSWETTLFLSLQFADDILVLFHEGNNFDAMWLGSNVCTKNQVQAVQNTGGFKIYNNKKLLCYVLTQPLNFC